MGMGGAQSPWFWTSQWLFISLTIAVCLRCHLRTLFLHGGYSSEDGAGGLTFYLLAFGILHGPFLFPILLNIHETTSEVMQLHLSFPHSYPKEILNRYLGAVFG